MDAATRLSLEFPELFFPLLDKVDAKAPPLAALLSLARKLLADAPKGTRDRLDLEPADVEAGVRQHSLPPRGLVDLGRLACDPSSIEFESSFDHFLYHAADFPALMTGRVDTGLAPALHVILLAAGLMKFMGRFGAAERIYRALEASAPDLCKALGLVGIADLHHVAALWARHLREDERTGASATAVYGIEALLRRTLRWSGLQRASLDRAADLYRRAAQIAPDLPLAQYGLALCEEALGRTARAIKRFQTTRGLLAPDCPLAQSLLIRVERLDAARSLHADRNWLRLEPFDAAAIRREGLATACCNVVPSERIAYRYWIHDGDCSRSVARQRDTRELSAFAAEGIRILGPGAAPIALKDRYLLADSLMFSGFEREMWDPHLVSANAGAALYADREGPTIEEDLVVLPGLGGFYFHFLFDVIGALSLVPSHEWSGRKLLFSQAPLAGGELLGWQKEVLSMLGIAPTDVMLCPASLEQVRVRRGIVCSHPGQDNAVAPWVVQFLRRRLLPGEHRARAGKRVFFTRTTTRRLQDDRADRLAVTARSYGFVIRDPTQLSVRQQRDLLADCEVFMSEAGSALANIVFLPAGAKVVTLATKLGFKDYFCPIAASLGIAMHVVLSDIKAIYPRHQFLWSAFSPDLDFAALERCLQAVTAPPYRVPATRSATIRRAARDRGRAEARA